MYIIPLTPFSRHSFKGLCIYLTELVFSLTHTIGKVWISAEGMPLLQSIRILKHRGAYPDRSIRQLL